MTLEEAKQIAEKNKYAKNLVSIEEFPDRYVFTCLDDYWELMIDGKGMSFDPPSYIMKNTGEVGTFFYPDYDDEFLASGVEVFRIELNVKHRGVLI